MKTETFTRWLWIIIFTALPTFVSAMPEGSGEIGAVSIKCMSQIKSNFMPYEYEYPHESHYGKFGISNAGPMIVDVETSDNQVSLTLRNVTYYDYDSYLNAIGNISYANIPVEADGTIVTQDAYPAFSPGDLEGVTYWEGVREYGAYPSEINGFWKDGLLNVVIKIWVTCTYNGESGEMFHQITLSEMPSEYQYSRGVTAGNYGTIVLPFKPERISGIAQLYSLAGKKLDSNGKIEGFVLQPETEWEAGVPYIFFSNDDEITAWASGDAEYAGRPLNKHYDEKWRVNTFSNNALQGTYEKSTTYDIGYISFIDDGCGYYEEWVTYPVYLLSNNQFVRAGARSYVDSNRAYIISSRVPEFTESNDAKYVFFNVDSTTDITDARNHSISNDRIYNLAGQRLPSPQKGVNIVNGKKVIIK
ncbi:MAG: hypothetical protein J6W75_12480 [Bacteroidaceae bacterium]|nr:hypothetical protein [Bacteroidaceae bacterium]